MACRFDSRPPLGPWLVLSRGLSRRWGASTDGGHSRTGGELAGQPQLPPVGLCRRRRVRRGWHSRGLTSDQAWAGELGVMRRLRFVPRGCRCSPAPRIVPARSTRSSCRWNRGAVPPCRGGARGVCRPDHINGWPVCAGEGRGVCAVDVGAGWRCCCPGPRLRCVTMHLGRNLGKGVLSVSRGPVRQGTPSSCMIECMQPKREGRYALATARSECRSARGASDMHEEPPCIATCIECERSCTRTG